MAEGGHLGTFADRASGVSFVIGCSICDEKGDNAEALVYCEQCIKPLCKACTELHSQLHSKHVFIGKDYVDQWGDTKRKDAIDMCGVHVDKEADMFCHDHDAVCCHMCASTKHRTCRLVQHIQDVAKGIHQKPEFQKILRSVSMLQAKLNEMRKRKHSNRQQLQYASIKILSAIKFLRQKINETLNAIELDTKQQLDLILTESETTLKRSIDVCQFVHDELKKIQDDIRTKKMNDESSAFRAYKTCKKKCKDFKEYLQSLQAVEDISLTYTRNTEVENILSSLNTFGCISSNMTSAASPSSYTSGLISNNNTSAAISVSSSTNTSGLMSSNNTSVSSSSSNISDLMSRNNTSAPRSSSNISDLMSSSNTSTSSSSSNISDLMSSNNTSASSSSSNISDLMSSNNTSASSSSSNTSDLMSSDNTSVSSSSSNISDLMSSNNTLASRSASDISDLMSSNNTSTARSSLNTFGLLSSNTTSASTASAAVQSLYRKTRVYSIEYIREYDVRTDSDTEKCWITGVCVLPDGNYVITDLANETVKLLDDKYSVIHADKGECIGEPNGVCHIVDDKVAVTATVHSNPTIHFFEKRQGKLIRTRSVTVNHNCRSITCHRKRMYIGSDEGLFVYNVVGEQTCKLYTQPVNYVAVGENGKRIYATTPYCGLITLDHKGNQLSTLLTDDSGRYGIPGIAVTVHGNVFAYDQLSHTIIQVEEGGRKKLSTLAKRLDNPQALCFDRMSSELIVGQDSNKILVIRLI